MTYTVKTLTELRKLDAMKARVRPIRDMASQRHKDWLLHAKSIEAQNWEMVGAVQKLAVVLEYKK